MLTDFEIVIKVEYVCYFKHGCFLLYFEVFDYLVLMDYEGNFLMNLHALGAFALIIWQDC